jgi:hypothetical protein
MTGRNAGLVFGRSETLPFDYARSVSLARETWDEAGLPRVGLHEARHTFASLMIAAGVNAKALSTYRGTPPSRSRSTGMATCCQATKRTQRLSWRLS